MNTTDHELSMNIFYHVTLSDVEYLIEVVDESDPGTASIQPYPEFSIPIVKKIVETTLPKILKARMITAETFRIDLEWLVKHIVRELYETQRYKKEPDYSAYRLFNELISRFLHTVAMCKDFDTMLKKNAPNPKWDLNKELPKFIMAKLLEVIEILTPVMPYYTLPDGRGRTWDPEDHSKIIITAFSILLNVQRGTPLLGRYREEPLSLEESEYVAKNECASLEVNRQLIDSLLREHDTEKSS